MQSLHLFESTKQMAMDFQSLPFTKALKLKAPTEFPCRILVGQNHPRVINPTGLRPRPYTISWTEKTGPYLDLLVTK